jgi:hypothetical protein
MRCICAISTGRTSHYRLRIRLDDSADAKAMNGYACAPKTLASPEAVERLAGEAGLAVP